MTEAEAEKEIEAGKNILDVLDKLSEADKAFMMVKYSHLLECDRCANSGTMSHTCPYKSDVDGDDETLCNCCADCVSLCGDEI
jgi:hypothetical protein